MVSLVNLKRLWSGASLGGLYDDLSYVYIAMNAANEKGYLPIFILAVNIDTATNQKLSYTLSVIFTSKMQGGGQLSIWNVWLRTRAF
jgi:hypothetical protein